MTDSDNSSKAQEFIQNFLNRLGSGEVAAFHISYVGFGDDQTESLTGGFEKEEELIAVMEKAIEGTKKATRGTVQ